MVQSSTTDRLLSKTTWRTLMADDICGVRLRHEPPSASDFLIDTGHEWIEFVDGSGKVTFSAGFYPAGNIVWGKGQVDSPDPHGGGAGNSISLDHFNNSNCKDCDAVRQCIRDRVNTDKGDPPRYSVAINNCRDWARG